jgi:hypothetical protein
MRSESVATLATLLLIAVNYSSGNAQAQQPRPADGSCRSAEQVTNDLAESKKLPTSSEVLVTGMVVAPQLLKRRSLMTVSEAIALVGGMKRDSGSSIYLLKQSPDHEIKIETVMDIKEVRQGRRPDLELMGGVILYLPEICPTKLRPTVDPWERPVAPVNAKRQMNPIAGSK